MRRTTSAINGAKAKLKSWVLPSGSASRRIRSGLLKGLRMELDLATQSQRWLGLQERELNRWFKRLGRNIESAVDVGANDGFYTIYFLAHTSARSIYAFEPSADFVRELNLNLALNGLAEDSRLHIVKQGVTATPTAETTTLNLFAKSLAAPCLIKVDIDGGEAELLRGSTEILAMPSVRWIIEVHSPQLERECMGILQQAGYEVKIVPNAPWRVLLPELRPLELNRWLVAYRPNDA